MNTTLLLLNPKIRSLRNSLQPKKVLKRLPFICIGLIFWIAFYIGSYVVLDFIRDIYFFGEMLSKKLLSITFFSLGIFLVLSNIITALSAFYLSKDIPFLITLPIRTKDMLRVKTLETIMNSSWMVISFIPPFFLAYGIHYNASLQFYLVLVSLFIPFLLLSGGIGIVIAHFLTRVFSAKKIRLALLAAGLLLFVIVYIWFKSQWQMRSESPEQIVFSLFSIKTDSPFLPCFWITESVFPLLDGETPNPMYLILMMSIWPFMFMVASIAGNKLYIQNIERIQPSVQRKRKPRVYGVYPDSVAAILWKDIKIFLRDTGQWSQLLIIGALMFIYIYNFKTLPLKTFSEIFPFMKEFLVLINLLMAGLILSAVSARFLYSSMSLEGMAIWILKTSPVTMKRLLWSKFICGFLPVTVILLTVVLITNIAMEADVQLIVLSVITIFILCISISGLGTGMGAMYPKFKYEDIASISMSPGGLLFMLLSFLVVLLTVFLEAWPFYLYKKAILSGLPVGLKKKIMFVLSGVGILILNAFTFYIPMRIGKKRIEEDISV